MSFTSKQSSLPTLPPGRERIKQLVATWPRDTKQSSAGNLICSAAGILRWMARILEEDGPQAPKWNPSNALLSFSLAEFPSHTDQKTGEKLRDAIAACVNLFDSIWESRGRIPHVFELLESAPMLKTLWSEPHNLLYKTQVWSDCNGTIDLIEWPITRIANAGLVYIEDPNDLAAAVQSRLGISKGAERLEQGTPYLFFDPTPPQFIRIRWHNKSDSVEKAAFHTLQSFDLSVQSARLEAGELTFPFSTTGYRLICCVKVPLPGEVPYTPHFYTCDGRYFAPPVPNSKLDWSCNAPGSYYLVYYKSEVVRRMSLERAAPFPHIEEIRRKGSSGTTTYPTPPTPIAKEPERKTSFKSDPGPSTSPPRTLHSQASKPTLAATSNNRPRRESILPRLGITPTGPRAPPKSPERVLQPVSQPPNQLLPTKRDAEEGRTVRIREAIREIPSPPRKRRKSDNCVPETVFWKQWNK
ncbi:hypothetical protein GGR53DRAFT_507072 [Hypoxylon sp. FL1150]|nr:hypothetical protein GGR53DRAFT_507072 [Hypoxylon sp. FL1150]